MAAERQRELWAAAEADRLARAARPPIPNRAPTAGHVLTIRYAFPDDARALQRLAALDSSEAPVAPVLIAEVDGHLRAAISLSDGDVVADPFHPTVAVIDLLQARARQLAASRPYAEPRSLPARARVSLARAVRRSV